MRLKEILDEIATKPNGFAHASVIVTRCSEAAEIIARDLLPLADKQQTEDYKKAIERLNGMSLLLDKYAATVNEHLQGDTSLFADIRNASYNAIEAVISSIK